MLSQRLIDEKSIGFKGGIYHKVQIELAYNFNHIKGSQLSHDQTRYIFGTNTIGFEEGSSIRVDDIVEVSNHFTALYFLVDSFSKRIDRGMDKRNSYYSEAWDIRGKKIMGSGRQL